MNAKTTLLPAGTPTKQQEDAHLKLLKILEYAQGHIEKTDMIKSITVTDKDFTLTIKPNGKA